MTQDTPKPPSPYNPDLYVATGHDIEDIVDDYMRVGHNKSKYKYGATGLSVFVPLHVKNNIKKVAGALYQRECGALTVIQIADLLRTIYDKQGIRVPEVVNNHRALGIFFKKEGMKHGFKFAGRYGNRNRYISTEVPKK